MINAAAASDEELLMPFRDFFADLKNNGFSVTASQVIDANAVIIQFAARMRSEQELCIYLLPLFAHTAEQQEVFRDIFQRHFPPAASLLPPPLPAQPSLLKRITRKHWKWLVAIYAVAAMALALFIIRPPAHKKPNPKRISVLVKNAAPNYNITDDPEMLTAFKNKPLELTVKVFYQGEGTNRFSFTHECLFNWGDGSLTSSDTSHTYAKQGIYNFNANIIVSYKGEPVRKELVKGKVYVCDCQGILNIVNHGRDTIYEGQRLSFSASLPAGDVPHFIGWFRNDSLLSYTDECPVNFPHAGIYKISCLARFNTVGFPCNLWNNRYITVLSRHPGTPPVPKQTPVIKDSLNKVPPVKFEAPPSYFSSLFLTLVLMFLPLAIVFGLLRFRELSLHNKIKKSTQEKFEQLAPQPGQQTRHGLIPFPSRNYLPMMQSELNRLVRLLRKRVSDGSLTLDIPGTIKKSISGGGMLQPVKKFNSRQAEYLVLIEKNEQYPLQVKLFEYLVATLKRQTVAIDEYYYDSTFAQFHHPSENKSLSPDKLLTRYQHRTLLIMGDASPFIENKPEPYNGGTVLLIKRWIHKAIITPASFPDWGQPEKDALQSSLPVFPADMEALVVMAEFMAHTEREFDLAARLGQLKHLFYKAAAIDFTDITVLQAYCDTAGWAVMNTAARQRENVLFQWIAALAVYPEIRWEVILAIGKVILEKYNCRVELNYNNLLKIVRISWVREAVFPETTRLELLKCLTVENEVVARQTMLMLLQEIPERQLPAGSETRRQKEVQEIINEFSLYAHAPVYFEKYKRASGLFEALWQKNALQDAPLEIYLKNPNREWGTLIHQPAGSSTTVSASIEEYFTASHQEENILSQLYLWLCIISLLVFLFSLAAIYIINVQFKVSV